MTKRLWRGENGSIATVGRRPVSHASSVQRVTATFGVGGSSQTFWCSIVKSMWSIFVTTEMPVGKCPRSIQKQPDVSKRQLVPVVRQGIKERPQPKAISQATASPLAALKLVWMFWSKSQKAFPVWFCANKSSTECLDSSCSSSYSKQCCFFIAHIHPQSSSRLKIPATFPKMDHRKLIRCFGLIMKHKQTLLNK